MRPHNEAAKGGKRADDLVAWMFVLHTVLCVRTRVRACVCVCVCVFSDRWLTSRVR